MKQTSSLHTAVITKGLRRGRPGPGPVIMSIIIWPMAGAPVQCAGCLKSWPLELTLTTQGVSSSGTTQSAAGYLFVILCFNLDDCLICPSERIDLFDPLHSAQRRPVFTQCAQCSISPGPAQAHCDLVTGCCQSRGGSQTVMLSCQLVIMTTWQRHDQHVMAVMDQRLDLIVSKSVG